MTEHFSRRTLLSRGALAVAATTALAGCSGGDSTPTEDFDGPVVEVGPDARNVFSPGTSEPLRIEPGTQVHWVWRSANHNIAVRNQPSDADWGGDPDIHHSGHTYAYTFEVPGQYRYVCEPHEGMGMVADIVVESAEE